MAEFDVAVMLCRVGYMVFRFTRVQASVHMYVCNSDQF